MTSDPDPAAPAADQRPRAPVFHRIWGALLVVFGLWLSIGVAMSISYGMSISKPAVEWIVEGIGVGVCLALLVTGFSLWMGSRGARVSAVALIALGIAGFVVAAANGVPLNGLVGAVIFGVLGGVSLLLARATPA